jgi:hypothetical protein
VTIHETGTGNQEPDDTDPDDPHAGCWQPHLGPHGPADCNGQPL